MDKLDYLILSELFKDASLTFVEIAKNIGSTPYTVRRRYEKMKKEGTIFKSIVSIDLSKIGYQGKVFLLITLAPKGSKIKAIEYLKSLKNVMVVTEIIGMYDILAIAPITDLKSIQEIVKEVKKEPYIERVELACADETSFPVNPNLGTILSQKSRLIAKS